MWKRERTIGSSRGSSLEMWITPAKHFMRIGKNLRTNAPYIRMCAHNTRLAFNSIEKRQQKKIRTRKSHIWTQNITPFSMIYGIFINICRASLSSTYGKNAMNSKCSWLMLLRPPLPYTLTDCSVLSIGGKSQWKTPLRDHPFSISKRCNFHTNLLYNRFQLG